MHILSYYLTAMYVNLKANNTAQVVGLRYFNVFGPNEAHKDKMASLVRQMFYKNQETGVINLFEGTDGYENGGQTRDFIYVKDVVNVNFYFWEHPEISGTFNCGTGHAHTSMNSCKLLSTTMVKVALNTFHSQKC